MGEDVLLGFAISVCSLCMLVDFMSSALFSSSLWCHWWFLLLIWAQPSLLCYQTLVCCCTWACSLLLARQLHPGHGWVFCGPVGASLYFSSSLVPPIMSGCACACCWSSHMYHQFSRYWKPHAGFPARTMTPVNPLYLQSFGSLF